jgi:hypothetical protein
MKIFERTFNFGFVRLGERMCPALNAFRLRDTSRQAAALDKDLQKTSDRGRR